MKAFAEIVKGKYRHFKGSFYEVICLARHSETLEDLVVFKALYGDQAVWVRPTRVFSEIVEVGGKRMPRYELVEKY